MYELILDIDGVLVNTDESYSRAAILTAHFFGAGLRQLEDVFSLRSLGNFNDDYDIACEFLRQDSIDVSRRGVIDQFQSFYLGPYWREGEWTGLITEEPLLAHHIFCDWVKKHKFSVFTGRPKDEAFYLMKRLRLFDPMDHLVGMYDVTNKKPDPEGLIQIIKLQNYQNPLSCGDTLDDFRAAQAAGVEFVGILPPHPEAKKMMKKAFQQEGCSHVLESVNDLPAYCSDS